MDNRDTIPFLVKQEVVFVCEKCGDTINMRVPQPNNTNERSYCCKAAYRVSNDFDGEIIIIRIEDRDDNKTEAPTMERDR